MATDLITLAYIYVPQGQEHAINAQQFVASFMKFPPLYPFRLIVILQNCEESVGIKSLFAPIGDVAFFRHDNSGHDIGGYIALAKMLNGDSPIMCFGDSSFFRRAGWLKRMIEAWEKHGPAFYGVTGSYEVSPHLNTSGILLSCSMLQRYPFQVKNKMDRYDFEHGPNALWKLESAKGSPVKLVTWTGEYDWPEWRSPMNIFRRGDQSNIVAYWHHCIHYETASLETKRAMEGHSDTISDPYYIPLARSELYMRLQSALYFITHHGLNTKQNERIIVDKVHATIWTIK